MWLTSHLRFFDFLPGVTATHVIDPNNIAFASALLQLRGSQYFVAPNREIDPFYTVGYIHRRGLWTMMLNNTLVTNYRHPPFNRSIPQQSNMTIISDAEINHPVMNCFPNLVAFVRAEPIYNFASHKAPGISGFNFRLYGGLRLTMNKPSYYGGMENLRKQIMEQESQAPPQHSSAAPLTEGAPEQATSNTKSNLL